MRWFPKQSSSRRRIRLGSSNVTQRPSQWSRSCKSLKKFRNDRCGSGAYFVFKGKLTRANTLPELHADVSPRLSAVFLCSWTRIYARMLFPTVGILQKTTAADTISTIDQLIGHLRDAQSRLATSQAEESPLPALSSKVTTLATHSQTAHKEFASSLSKFGKSLEKRFKPIVQTTSPFEGKREVLDKVISKHLIREGRFASARAFEAEGGAKAEGSDAFAEMYAVLAALRGIPENEHEENAMMTDSPVTRKKPDLAPAIAWAKRNAVELYAASSHLEFELHRTRFIQMRDDGAPRNMLVDYVRTEMSGWVGRGFEKGGIKRVR